MPATNNADQSQLVIVDIQERLGEAMPTKVLNRVLANASLLVKAATLTGVPMHVTEQYPDGLGPTHAALAGLLPDTTDPIAKTAFSACGADGFLSAIARQDQRRQIVLVGMEAHVCVLQTALDLAAHGLEVFVVEDAICSRRLENYQNALDRLRGTDVTVTSGESVVFEWLSDASHPAFKAVQALLR
ncbi:MAG: isochorismatase family protein [Gammaproteobacteria bacterium]|nr:isochorismatase family protein [Gammaproteobacteria bacterium]NNL99912.1 isochorismatase family protein [Gammaproteobacteria bacterium]